MGIKSKVSVAAVVGAVVLAGGCSPQMKTAGYVGGTALLLGGVGARMDAEHGNHDLEDLVLVIGEYYLGTAAVITGAIIVLAALVSPSESTAPATTSPPAPLPAPSLVPPPSGSPTAPSGSPLNPLTSPVKVQGPVLSMRGPSSPAFR